MLSVSKKIKPRSILVLVWLVHLTGLFFFVVKPLFFDALTQEHFTTSHDPNQDLKPLGFTVGVDQANFDRSMAFQVTSTIEADRIRSFRFMIATYHTTIGVTNLSLRTRDGRCTFLNSSIKALHDNSTVTLMKSECRLVQLEEGSELILDIKTIEPDQNLALWVSPKPSPYDKLGVKVRSEANDAYPVGGFGFAIQPLQNRFEIIQAVWSTGLPPGTLQIILLILAFCPLAFFFIFNGLVRSTFLMFVSIVGFCVIYTFIIPPLQAPDEADHFASYAHLNLAPGLPDEILSNLNRSHYDRVFCHDNEKIDSYDVAHPLRAVWPVHAPVLDVPERSLLGASLWRFYHKVIGVLPASEILSRTRILNAMVIAIAICILGVLIGFRRPETISMLPFISAASIPTFWFFATHLSNHTLIVVGYLGLLAVAFNLLLREKFQALTVGAGLVFLVISLLSGRAAMPSLIAMCLLLCIGIVIEKSDWKKYLIALVLLVGTTVSVFFALKNTAYLQSIVRQVLLFSGQYFSYILLASIAAALSLIVIRKASLAGVRSLSQRRAVGTFLISIGAVALMALLWLPLLKNVHLENTEFTEKPELLAYLKKTAIVLITNLGLGGNDFLVIRSLWGGFGCPDNFFSQGLIEILKGQMLVGWFLAIFHSVKIGNYQNLFKSGLILLVGACYFILLAFLCWSMSATVIGRYNVGFMLILLSVSSYGWYRLFEGICRRLGISEQAFAAICYTGVSLITFASMNQLLQRYYA